MASAAARYEGHSEWYEETFSRFDTKEEKEFLAQGLGVGNGDACLDVACGTGFYGQTIADAGYRAVGFDISADQLRFARRRFAAAVRADGCFLPVRDEAAAAVVGMFFHTDVEDFGAVSREMARCLRPGGSLVYVGLHPCFLGPFVDRTAESEDLRLSFVGGYGEVGWADRASGDGSEVGRRVGFHHKTLAVSPTVVVW